MDSVLIERLKGKTEELRLLLGDAVNHAIEQWLSGLLNEMLKDPLISDAIAKIEEAKVGALRAIHEASQNIVEQAMVKHSTIKVGPVIAEQAETIVEHSVTKELAKVAQVTVEKSIGLVKVEEEPVACVVEQSAIVVEQSTAKIDRDALLFAIRKKIIKLDLSYQAVADKVGCSKSTIGRLFLKEPKVTEPIIQKIATKLGIKFPNQRKTSSNQVLSRSREQSNLEIAQPVEQSTTMIDRNALVAAIREKKKSTGLTAQAIAEKTGLSKSVVEAILRTKSQGSYQNVQKVAAVLEILSAS